MKNRQMHEYEIQQLLEALAREEIPDDMDLWNEIQARLETPQVRPVKPAVRISKYLIVAAILLLVSTAYAVLQSTGHGGDSGIVGVSQANLITDLNIVKSLDDADVNVSLDWAYADGHRIAVGWTVDFSARLAVPYPTEISLYDENGQAFGPADFLRGGGGGGGGGDDRVMFGSTSSFDATTITGSPETLNLKLVMKFDGPADTGMAPGTSAGGGSGGGSGGSSGDTSATEETLPTLIPTIPVAPFTMEFEFSVPFIPAVRLDHPLTSTANGITMTLNDLSYAPSATLGNLCFTRPESDPALVWRPNIRMDIKGILMDAGGMYPPDGAPEDAPEICGELVILATLKVQADTVRLSIDRLQTYPDYSDANIETFKQLATDAGFEIAIQKIKPDEIPDMKGVGNILFYLRMTPQETTLAKVLKVPDDVGENYYGVLENLQDQAFRQSVQGPWTFEVKLD